ncbi:IIGP5-like protein [Mya arenaria]|uniref:IIGP5-like protein n=1 Tax=Mya arenaria TaxID=6604 RepID=A0ABY7G6T7_MYAAR|nr:IIGP5-like protein [Mya arenaria]
MMVRDIRNKISHTADYKLDKQTADEYLEKMIELLNDGRELRNDPFAIVNRRHLQDIKDGKSQCSRKTSTRMELEVCTHNLNNLEEDENYNMFDLNQMSGDEEKSTVEAVLPSPNVNWFSNLGITVILSASFLNRKSDSLAVEQTLVRRLATKEVTQQTGQLLESKANTRDMQSQIYTDTNRDLDENSNIVEDVRNGIEQFENISKATMITIFKEYGYLGLQKELQKRLNTWKTVKLNIAVIGRAGVGKSTFINTFLKNTKTRTGSVETTNEYKHYHHSELDALIVWNIPGVGSPSFPLNGYLEKIGFDRYDFFLLMLSDRVYGDDLWLMNQIFENKKKAFIIRTKTDQALANRLYDYPGMSEEKVYAKLKQNMVQEFKSANVEQSRIFRICGHDDNLFEFKQLITTIVRETPDLKKSAVTLCVTTVSDEIITAKVAELRKRIYEISLVASLGAAIPIPGAGILVQVSLLYDEAEFYRKQLGTDENTMKEIAKRLNCHIEDLQVRLSMKMHIILRTKTAFAAFLGTLVATEGVESLLKIAIPVIGSIIAAGANYPLCVYSLRKVLSDLEKEARHLNKFLAEWVERESLI